MYAAVAVSLLALLVAATTTAYAAGLAKNSVGAKQLKKNAVKTAKIKNGAVTTAKIKAGAVTADRIASGVVPARTVHVARTLPPSSSVSTLLQLGGLSFDATCNSTTQDFVQVEISRIGGGSLTASGLFSLETNTLAAAVAYPLVEDTNVLDLFTMAPSDDGFGRIVFDGVVTPAGGGPVQVQVTVQVDDGTPNPCRTYVTATPIG
jgi:hypothetical protein